LVVTAEIKVSCLRPGIGERLIAKGQVLKPGRNIHFCESEVWAVQDGKEVLVAKSSSSMAVVRGRNQ
jgi:acyl-coenzyme A thioesterase PaaI-like protein